MREHVDRGVLPANELAVVPDPLGLGDLAISDPVWGLTKYRSRTTFSLILVSILDTRGELWPCSSARSTFSSSAALLDTDARVRDHHLIEERSPAGWPSTTPPCSRPSTAWRAQAHPAEWGVTKRPPRATTSHACRPRLPPHRIRAPRRPLRRARHHPRRQESVVLCASS